MKVGYINKKTLAIAALAVFLTTSMIVVGIIDGAAKNTDAKPTTTHTTNAKKATATKGPSAEAISNSSLSVEASQYTISAVYDETKKQINGTLTLDYCNKTGTTLKEVYFCLYPNAFKNESNNVNPAELYQKAYPNGFSSGSITVNDVKVNNKSEIPTFESVDQIMRVPLNNLKKNKRVSISMNFSLTIPNTPMRFGYGDQTVNLGNWYPIACVYENSKWNKCIYTANGDPFYSDISNYQIELTLPAEYKLACTGTILQKNTTNPLKTTWKIDASTVRDFACVLSKDFKLKSRLAGDTIVYSYYLGEDYWGEKALQHGVDAVKIYNDLFGKYPYGQLSIVANDFYIGGMEYPNLVMINKNFYQKDAAEALEEVTVHEVAHQWWYSIVGNDEINEAWLDEGLTQYTTMLYYENIYGKDSFNNMMEFSKQYYKSALANMQLKLGTVNEKIDRPSYEFEDWRLYDALTYDKTAFMFDTLRETLGDDAFFSSLQCYFDKNKFTNASRKDLASAFKEKSRVDVSKIMSSWLDGKVLQPVA